MTKDDWIPPLHPREGRMELSLVPAPGDYHVTRHRPSRFLEPFHHHASIEVNYLHGISMRYAFAEHGVEVPPWTLVLFWALVPHRVTEVSGEGEITALYLPLSSLMGRQRHKRLLDALLRGEVLGARRASPEDEGWLGRLVDERREASATWSDQHLAEIDVRLGRFALEGWETLSSTSSGEALGDHPQRTIRQVERMMAEIADRFDEPVGVADIAAAVDLSEGHAAEVFRAVTGRTIKTQITQLRLAHAQMLLLETDLKIAAVANDSGFGSVSSFYAAFRQQTGLSPVVFRRRRGDPGLSSSWVGH